MLEPKLAAMGLLLITGEACPTQNSNTNKPVITRPVDGNKPQTVAMPEPSNLALLSTSLVVIGLALCFHAWIKRRRARVS